MLKSLPAQQNVLSYWELVLTTGNDILLVRMEDNGLENLKFKGVDMRDLKVGKGSKGFKGNHTSLKHSVFESDEIVKERKSFVQILQFLIFFTILNLQY
jgi:hypothetical protein